LNTNSPQYVIDCFLEAQGCNGGDPLAAQQWIITNLGTCNDATVPYQGKSSGSCEQGCDKSNLIGSVQWLPTMDENAMKEAVAKGPIAGAVYADSDSFKYYQGGIYNDGDCPSDMNSLNHAISLVGYGTDVDGTDYWVLRNTWGVNWGEAGYMRMMRGSNICGVAIDTSQPALNAGTGPAAMANAVPLSSSLQAKRPATTTLGAKPTPTTTPTTTPAVPAARTATAATTPVGGAAATAAAVSALPKPTPPVPDEVAEDGHIHNHGIDPE